MRPLLTLAALAAISLGILLASGERATAATLPASGHSAVTADQFNPSYPIPAQGFGLVIWEAGSLAEMLQAAQAANVNTIWATLPSGAITTYRFGVSGVVNAGFNSNFAGGLPTNTVLLVRAG